MYGSQWVFPHTQHQPLPLFSSAVQIAATKLRIILLFTSTMSSGVKNTVAPNFLAHDIRYFALSCGRRWTWTELVQKSRNNYEYMNTYVCMYLCIYICYTMWRYIFVSSSIHSYGCVYTYVSIHIRAVWYLCIECIIVGHAYCTALHCMW